MLILTRWLIPFAPSIRDEIPCRRPGSRAQPPEVFARGARREQSEERREETQYPVLRDSVERIPYPPPLSTLLTTWALVLQPLACLLGHGYVRHRISSAAGGDRIVTVFIAEGGKCLGLPVTIVLSAVARATATKGISSGSGSLALAVTPRQNPDCGNAASRFLIADLDNPNFGRDKTSRYSASRELSHAGTKCPAMACRSN